MTSATPTLSVDGARIAAERDWLLGTADEHAERINEARDALGAHFGEEVAPVSVGELRTEIETVFDRPRRAVNIAALITLTRAIDVPADYPGFVVDERLGRQLAATIAGGEPATTLAEATFHFMDIHHDTPSDTAGLDDLHAGIAAGFQPRMPGWDWQAADAPFDI